MRTATGALPKPLHTAAALALLTALGGCDAGVGGLYPSLDPWCVALPARDATADDWSQLGVDLSPWSGLDRTWFAQGFWFDGTPATVEVVAHVDPSIFQWIPKVPAGVGDAQVDDPDDGCPDDMLVYATWTVSDGARGMLAVGDFVARTDARNPPSISAVAPFDPWPSGVDRPSDAVDPSIAVAVGPNALYVTVTSPPPGSGGRDVQWLRASGAD